MHISPHTGMTSNIGLPSGHVTELPPYLICTNKGPGLNGNTYVAIFSIAFMLLDYCMSKAFHNGNINGLTFRIHTFRSRELCENFYELVIQILCKMLYALILTIIILSKGIANLHIMWQLHCHDMGNIMTKTWLGHGGSHLFCVLLWVDINSAYSYHSRFLHSHRECSSPSEATLTNMGK